MVACAAAIRPQIPVLPHFCIGQWKNPTEAGIALANARLVAAAPDLLALLEELASMAASDAALFKDSLAEPFYIVWEEKIRDAIAKATGGANSQSNATRED